MAGFNYNTNEHLVRSNLWSSQIKEVLLDELFAQKYVDMITDFPDGDTLNIPSIGQAEVIDYDEGQAVRYTAMDTGNFTFTINKYKSSATYITNKMKQDSFYMSRLVSSFVPKQHRAIAKAMEVDILNLGYAGQTASNLNNINGGAPPLGCRGHQQCPGSAGFRQGALLAAEGQRADDESRRHRGPLCRISAVHADEHRLAHEQPEVGRRGA